MTSIEWLIDQLPLIQQEGLRDVWEQAKEMHKQEIIDAYNKSFELRDKPYSTADKYYQETFVSKVTDTLKDYHIVDTNEMVELPQQEICINCDEEKETHEICMDCIGKMIKENQQEISDEEIEKGAWDNPCLNRQDVYKLFDEVFKDKTLQGIFKISASKEVRQFKERLRQLAKEKYREQLKQNL